MEDLLCLLVLSGFDRHIFRVAAVGQNAEQKDNWAKDPFFGETKKYFLLTVYIAMILDGSKIYERMILMEHHISYYHLGKMFAHATMIFVNFIPLFAIWETGWVIGSHLYVESLFWSIISGIVVKSGLVLYGFSTNPLAPSANIRFEWPVSE